MFYCCMVLHTVAAVAQRHTDLALLLSEEFTGPLLILQGSGEQLILDEGRVNKFNKRFASIGSFGQVAPASTGGDKKLEYKVSQLSSPPFQLHLPS